jgi:hypothetical protein
MLNIFRGGLERKDMQELTLDILAYGLAEWFHNTYEELAPEYGYDTRQETKGAWDTIPDEHPNKQLMIAVCKKLLQSDFIRYTTNSTE